MVELHRPHSNVDAERGIHQSSPPISSPKLDSISRLKNWFLKVLSTPKPGTQTQNLPRESLSKKVEDYPKGYPQFSALISTHESFHLFRRFSRVRTRLLLLSQDRITQLEQRLDEIDKAEASPLFLASSRRDSNEERRKVLGELQDALDSYDQLLEKYLHISSLPTAHHRDIKSLKNWNAANACISRQEMEFLSHEEDLFCLSAPNDNLISFLERYVAEKLLSFSGYGRSSVSRDKRVHLYSQDWTTLVTRTLITPLIVTIVMVPIVICNQFESLNVRLGITVASTSVFLLLLSLFTKGKMLELTVAAATYTTVLVAFVSSPG